MDETIRIYGEPEPDFTPACSGLRTVISAQLGVLRLRQQELGDERFMTQNNDGIARLTLTREGGTSQVYTFDTAGGGLTVTDYDAAGEFAGISVAGDDEAGYAMLRDFQEAVFDLNDAAYRVQHPTNS